MKKRDVLPIILVIAFCGILTYIYNNLHKYSVPKNFKSPSAGIVSFGDFDFTEYLGEGAYKKFTINGTAMGVAPKRFGIFQVAPFKVLQITDPEVVFYDKNARASVLRAKKAVFDTPYNDENYKDNMVKALSRRVEFTGGVSVISRRPSISPAGRVAAAPESAASGCHWAPRCAPHS